MSSIGNITVKKNDGTTDVVYSAIEGRSGDNPARWKAPALGATPATQPELRVGSRLVNGTNKAKVIATFVYPYHVVNSTTGVTSVVSKELFRLEYTGDNEIPQAVRDEGVSQGMNALASASFKTMLKELAAAV